MPRLPLHVVMAITVTFLAAFWQRAAAEPAATGKVAGLYAQSARHLLIELPLARRSAAHRVRTGEVVAEIHFAQPLLDGRSATFATLDAAQVREVDTGDIVSVALVASRGGKHAVAPLRQTDQVRAVEAKFHTALARNFGRTPGTPGTLGTAGAPATPEPADTSETPASNPPTRAKALTLAHAVSRNW